MRKTFLFEDLSESDLLVDAAYAGGSKGNVADDPIDRVVGGGNQGGFRYLGSPRNNSLKLCVLYSELFDPDWPDELNPESGTFVYYGDNKKPGHELHKTPRGGNLILRSAFEDLHHGRRTSIPPFFIFTKGETGRDVVFRGLAVPGAIGIPQTEDLVAIWKTKGGQRFQNYRAIFTILDGSSISRMWLNDLRRGARLSEKAPGPWVKWINGGAYTPLEAIAVTRLRSRAQQLPALLSQVSALSNSSQPMDPKLQAELERLIRAEAQRTEQENFDWACGMVVGLIVLVGFALFILMAMGASH
jgi:hypothetical protein